MYSNNLEKRDVRQYYYVWWNSFTDSYRLEPLIQENLNWNAHVSYLEKGVSQKFHFIFRLCCFFTPGNLPTIYISTLFPYVLEAAPKASLHLFDDIQRLAIRLIDKPELSYNHTLVSNRRKIGEPWVPVIYIPKKLLF